MAGGLADADVRCLLVYDHADYLVCPAVRLDTRYVYDRIAVVDLIALSDVFGRYLLGRARIHRWCVLGLRAWLVWVLMCFVVFIDRT